MAGRPITTELNTPGGIPYAVVEGPDATYERFGPLTGQVSYVMTTLNANSFVREIMPTPFKRKGYSYLPKAFVPMGPEQARPISATVSPFNSDRPFDVHLIDLARHLIGQRNYEDYAKVTVDYTLDITSFTGDMLTSQEPQHFLAAERDITAEAISTYPNKRAVVVSQVAGGNGQPIKELGNPIVLLIPVTQLTYNWNWCVDPAFPGIFDAIGKVNVANIGWLGNAPFETIMLVGVTGKNEYRWQFAKGSGVPSVLSVWSLQIKMVRRCATVTSGSTTERYGWNHIFNPDKQKWERIERDTSAAGDGSTTAPFYESSDFSALFKSTLTETEQADADVNAV